MGANPSHPNFNGVFPYPPTPAFAKARAAPGTTAGVKLVFPMCQPSSARLRPQHSVFKGCSSVPFARLQNSTAISTSHSGHSLPCAKPCEPFAAAPTSDSGHSILFLKPLRPQHSVFKGRSSLPFARLQNPQNAPRRHSGHSLPFDRPLLTLRGSSHKPLRPRHSVFKASQATAFCFLRGVQGSRFARHQNPQNVSRRHSGHSLPFDLC